jgi:hypothetical protein
MACLQSFLHVRGLNASTTFAAEFSRRAVSASESLGHVLIEPLDFSVSRWVVW